VTPEPVLPSEDGWSPARNLYAIALSEAQRWVEAALLTARRMRSGDPYEVQLDARLFLLALREVLYAVDLEQAEVKCLAPDARGPLKAARARFETSVPGVTAARDMIVHFDQYARGTGVEQRKLTSKGADQEAVARDFWNLSYDRHTDAIQAGPYRISVESAVKEARLLCHAMGRATQAIDARQRSEP
jgi:hypothetical protein